MITALIITHADRLVTWVGRGFTAVCLSVLFRTISQKPMQLGSQNLTYEATTVPR